MIQKESRYWDRLSNIVNDKHWNIWKILNKKLKKYYELLEERKKTIEEVNDLQMENKELRSLLNQYISSKINEELKISPINIL